MLRPKCLQGCRWNRLPAYVRGAGASEHVLYLPVQAALHRKIVVLTVGAGQ